jgi:hypothetical protein
LTIQDFRLRFITLDWWRGDDPRDPFPAYQAHLAKIRQLLPARLIGLQEDCRLHDAEVQSTRYESASGVFVIDLIAYEEEEAPARTNARRVRLRYSQVVSIFSTVDPRGALPGPGGYGHLGYDEVDVTKEGHLEHRLLFSTGIEMQIVFAEFGLEWEGLEDFE